MVLDCRCTAWQWKEPETPVFDYSTDSDCLIYTDPEDITLTDPDSGAAITNAGFLGELEDGVDPWVVEVNTTTKTATI